MIVDASLVIDAVADPGPRGVAARRALAADAIYVAAAERHHTGLLTADARIERSGAPITCDITTVTPAAGAQPACDRPRPEDSVE